VPDSSKIAGSGAGAGSTGPAGAGPAGAGAGSPGAVNAVVFDIGGVLLDWDPRHLYRRLFDDPAQMETFLATVCTPEWHRAHDLGAALLPSCQELAGQHPEQAGLILAWARRSEDMIAGQLDGTVEVLGDLSAAGVRVYALSNMEAETFPLRRKRYAFFGYFDGCVISGIEGVAKPDQEIFEILLARHGLEPARTVFVDDVPRNVAAAQDLGVTGIRFTSPEQLRRDLRGLGLPV
jgi:2-haloacid dehalogenase